MQISKVLLASTALMGVSLIAGSAYADGHSSVTTSGFVRLEAYGGDLEEKLGAGVESFDFATDSEVHVKYAATDEESGLSYGATVEFEADSQGADIDENYLFISGGFGEVRMGNEDGASDNMKVGGYSVAAGTGGIDGEGSVGTTIGIAIPNSGDATKVRYDSPVVGGFQVGVSFTPQAGDGTNRAANSQFENAIEAGVVYSGSFSGLDIKASAVAGFASSEVNNVDDAEGFGVGAQIGFSGFSVAGGIATHEGLQGGEDTEVDIVNLGIAADLGPASVSLTGQHAEKDNNTTNVDLEEDLIVVSASVGLLPGVGLDADLSFFDNEGGTDDDGVTGVVRIGVGF